MSSEKSKKGLRLLQFYKKFDHSSLKLSQLWDGDVMPFSLKSCIAFVYHLNIDAKHVLRKNGNKVAQEVLCSFIKKNKNEAPTFYMTSVYDVCSAVKAYVKDIPEGLLVKDLEHDWHKLVKLNNEIKVREKLMTIIQKLPLANKSMLYHLLFLASAVTEHRHNNEMSVKSLSIVLMPSIFEKVVNIMKVRDLNGFYDLLEFMIDNAKLIMGNEVYKRIESDLKEIGSRLHVVPQLDDEPIFLDEDKRVHFVSQDSGLNSNSFIDDKGSQSLSSISRTNNTDENISSIEDLLEPSTVTSKDSDNRFKKLNIFRSSTIVGKQYNSGSKDSPYRGLERSISRISSSSSISSRDNLAQESETTSTYRGIKQRVNQGLTCLGLSAHTIKECRPYSMCGSPSHNHTKLTSCQRDSNSIKVYKAVYDRSFQNIDQICDVHNFPCCKDNCQVSEVSYLQRKKPVLKRSSCIIAPLERFNTFFDSASLKTPTSTSTRLLSTSASDNAILNYATPLTLARIKKIQVPMNQKLRIKKKSFLFRSRFSAPIKVDDVEAPVLPSQRVLRAASLQQYQHKPTSLPLDKYLRQRSSEETFV